MGHQLKFYQNTSTLYLHIDAVRTYEQAIDLFENNKLVSNTINRKFLLRLREYANIHNKDFKSRKNVFLTELFLYLPDTYNLDYVSNHVLRFVTESLDGLPFFAFIKKNKKGINELHIIISERKYSNNQKLINVYEDHDVYMNQRDTGGMKFCKKSDKGAILVRKKGDIKKSYYSNFSMKSRMFSGSRKTFVSFVEGLKTKWITFFKALGIVKNQNFIQGISVKKAYFKNKINWYWLRNINYYNRLKNEINNDLTILFDLLQHLGISDYEDDYLTAWKLSNKYKNIFKMQKKIYFQRTDRVEKYFEELRLSWRKDYEKIISMFTQI